MEAQALYFPYIRVPEAGWFTRILLYWDSVGTIVPRSLTGSDSVIGAYTSDLMDANLVRQVWPENYIFAIDGFADCFFEVIDGNQEIRGLREQALHERTVGQIHEEKFTDEVFAGLKQRGLAERSNDYGWWNVESRTAGVYMAYLAATLGGLEELGMDPVSDSTNLFVSTLETPVARAEALRLGVLDAILPGPEEPVAVDELVRFKERHADPLKAFRTQIETELLRIALIEDDEARTREKKLTEDRLRQEIEEIAAAMRERRWPKILFGTIAGLAAVGATGAAALGTGGAALAFAAPGVISGAYAAVEGFPRRQTSGSPLAFAASAQKSFAR
jgi:hypothetical protein